MTPTIRKCVSQKEISSLQNLGVNTNNGCHSLRTTKRRHKLYCFCENDLCNNTPRLGFKSTIWLNILIFIYLFILL